MERQKQFTFFQYLINMIIVCSILVGLTLQNGTEFYNKSINVTVILVVLAVAIVSIIVKWRQAGRNRVDAHNVQRLTRAQYLINIGIICLMLVGLGFLNRISYFESPNSLLLWIWAFCLFVITFLVVIRWWKKRKLPNRRTHGEGRGKRISRKL